MSDSYEEFNENIDRVIDAGDIDYALALARSQCDKMFAETRGEKIVIERSRIFDAIHSAGAPTDNVIELLQRYGIKITDKPCRHNP